MTTANPTTAAWCESKLHLFFGQVFKKYNWCMRCKTLTITALRLRRPSEPGELGKLRSGSTVIVVSSPHCPLVATGDMARGLPGSGFCLQWKLRTNRDVSPGLLLDRNEFCGGQCLGVPSSRSHRPAVSHEEGAGLVPCPAFRGVCTELLRQALGTRTGNADEAPPPAPQGCGREAWG